jgi:hypothetical protein
VAWHASAARRVLEAAKGTRVAFCALWNHPIGAEMRCDVDGEMWQTKAARDLGELMNGSESWKAAFQQKGWHVGMRDEERERSQD